MCLCDSGRQDVLVFSVGGEGDAAGTPSVNPQIKVAKPPIVAEEPLQAELGSFLESVRARSTVVFVRRRTPRPGRRA